MCAKTMEKGRITFLHKAFISKWNYLNAHKMCLQKIPDSEDREDLNRHLIPSTKDPPVSASTYIPRVVNSKPLKMAHPSAGLPIILSPSSHVFLLLPLPASRTPCEVTKSESVSPSMAKSHSTPSSSIPFSLFSTLTMSSSFFHPSKGSISSVIGHPNHPSSFTSSIALPFQDLFLFGTDLESEQCSTLLRAKHFVWDQGEGN